MSHQRLRTFFSVLLLTVVTAGCPLDNDNLIDPFGPQRSAPTITGVTPNTGPTGGGTEVIITGTDLNLYCGSLSTPCRDEVTFGGTPAIDIRVSPDGFFRTVWATAPAHAAGAVSVVVRAIGGSATLANGFTYAGPPAVTSVTPSSGSAAGNTAITIAGTGFVAGATVTIGGSAATAVSVAGSTSVTATTPENVPGAASVVVTNPDGQSSTPAYAFTYVAGPTVTGVTPNSGPPAGGVQVTITGTGFTLVPTVRFGTGLFDLTTATGVAFINSTQIIATAPAHAAGAVMVIVSNPDGQSALLANAFTYAAPEAPKVTSISANTGGILGGDLITITGSGFVVDSTAVQFGAVPATSWGIATATSISVYTPPQAATGPVPVTVTTTTPNGQSSVTVPNGFTYVPTVSSVVPRQGYAYGGDDVVITGTGFVAGTTVKFGGDYATEVLNGQPTSVLATTPRHAPGVVDVTVENPDGTSGTLPNTFDYLAPTPLEKADWNVVYIWPGAAAVNHPARLVADVYGRLTGVATLGSETFTTVGYVKGNSVYVTFDVYQDNNPVGSITCSGQFAADSETGNQIIVGTFTATNMGLGGYLGGTATDTCDIY